MNCTCIERNLKIPGGELAEDYQVKNSQRLQRSGRYQYSYELEWRDLIAHLRQSVEPWEDYYFGSRNQQGQSKGYLELS